MKNRSKDALTEKVLEWIGSLKLVSKGERVLCALSGGADSALLLHLLRDTDSEIFAAHVNHGIRGKEADDDEIFCRNICHNLTIPFFSCRIDVPAIAKESGMGVEEAAREARYEYLHEVAKEHNCSLNKVCCTNS